MIALSPTGEILAVGNHAGPREVIVSFIEVASGKKVGQTLEIRDLDLKNSSKFAFSPDGSRFATNYGYFSESISVWETRSKGKPAEFKHVPGEQKTSIYAFALSPDGKTVLYATNCCIIAAKCDTGAVVRIMPDSPGRRCTAAMEYLPDGKHFVTAGAAGRLQVWDAARFVAVRQSQQQLKKDSHGEFVSALCVSTDGKLLATISEQNRLQVWDSETLEVGCETRLEKLYEKPRFLDEKLLSISNERVEVYDVTGEEPQQLKFSNSAEATLISPAAAFLLTAQNHSFRKGLRVLKPTEDTIATLPYISMFNRPCWGSVAFVSDDGQTIAHRAEEEEPGRINIYRLTQIREAWQQAEAERLKAVALAAAKKAAAEEEERKRLASEAAEAKKVRELAQAIVANQRPIWKDAVDLTESVVAFGGMGNDSVQGFVEFGTPESAKRWKEGDRFDREEVSEASAEHRKALREKMFFLQTRASWEQKQVAGDPENSISIRTQVPFKCWVSPNQFDVRVACYDRTDSWFMDTAGKLQQLGGGAAAVDEVRARGGAVYFRETQQWCDLLITVTGDRDFLKRTARETDRLSVNICFRGLKMQPLAKQGLFLVDALEALRFDTQRLFVGYDNGLNGKPEIPHYFVVQDYRGELGTAKSPPSVPVGEIVRIEIVRPNPEKREVIFDWESPESFEGELRQPR